MKRITTAAAAIVLGSFACLSLAACQTSISGQADAGVLSVAVVSGSGDAQTTVASAAVDLSADSVGSVSSGSNDETTQSSGATTAAHEPGSGQGQGTGPHTGAGTGKNQAATTASSDAGTTTSSVSSSSVSTSTKSVDAGAGSGSGSGNKSGSGSASSAGGGDSHSSDHSWTDDGMPRVVSASIKCTYSDDDQAYRETLTYKTANATGLALSVDNPGIVAAYGTYGANGTIEIPNIGCYKHYGEQRYDLYALNGPAPAGLAPSKTILRTGEYLQPGVDTTAAPQAPEVHSASVECKTGDDGQIHEFLSFEVRGATGMALSIDNPGLVGSFDTYGTSEATIEIPNNGCYAENGEQVYTLTTVGGTGPAASKTIKRTGTLSHSGGQTGSGSVSSDDSSDTSAHADSSDGDSSDHSDSTGDAGSSDGTDASDSSGGSDQASDQDHGDDSGQSGQDGMSVASSDS